MHYMCSDEAYPNLTHVKVQQKLVKAKAAFDAMIGSFYKDACYEDITELYNHPRRCPESPECGCPKGWVHL